MADNNLPMPDEGFVVTHFLTVEDVKRAGDFYANVLGGEIVMQGEPTMVKLANTWIILNVGGGPTDDKPDVILETPQNPNRINSFLNIRVADIKAKYQEWRAKGATFLTEPVEFDREFRAYMRDPDGYLIEVGEAKQLG